jgi:hypothetical protein
MPSAKNGAVAEAQRFIGLRGTVNVGVARSTCYGSSRIRLIATTAKSVNSPIDYSRTGAAVESCQACPGYRVPACSPVLGLYPRRHAGRGQVRLARCD